jgi:hypothetical protein
LLPKVNGSDGCSYIGQYKHGKEERYMTVKYLDGVVNCYKYKNGKPNGYGIQSTPD